MLTKRKQGKLSMKKLLSVVLVLAMLASMCIYLPMGVSAADTDATPIFTEDFSGLTDGDVYTLGDLADTLGWTLLRGDAAAEVATVVNGALVIDATALDQDVVFELATDARLLESHTVQYTMAKDSYVSGNHLFFSAIYTGTDNGEKVTAIVPKTTYEGYHHIAWANNSTINEGNIYSFAYNGGDHGQARPENIPYGGSAAGGISNGAEFYAAANTAATVYKNVYDYENNQIDCYASEGRINSTAGAQDDYWAGKDLSAYAGEGAYLRVQRACKATFDDISIVTGGEAVVVTSNTIYSQDFNNVTYDPETESAQDLANKIGFSSLTETAVNNVGTATMQYAINDGRLEILAVPHDGATVSGYNGNQQGHFGMIYLPEMEAKADVVVIDYDMTYLYDANVTGSLNHGDAPMAMEIYGRRNDFNAWWQVSQKGFPQYGFRNGNYKDGSTTIYPNSYGLTSTSGNNRPQSQGRWETTAFNAKAATYVFSNGSYGHSLIGSTEHITAVIGRTTGMQLYVNGVIALQMTDALLEAWLTTQGTANAKHSDVIGNVLRLSMTQGCHVALDNLKVTINPEMDYGLRITEWNCGVTATGYSTQAGSEYIEVYNSSTEAINIYDYVVLNRAYSNSMDQFGSAIGLDNIHLMYPGKHTFKSIKTDDTTGASLYTYDIENPAYADGWIQPG